MTAVDDRRRWNERYEARAGARSSSGDDLAPAPPAPLRRLAGVLPRQGRAVDLAGGDGGGGLLLAERGLDTIVVDVSDVGLQQAAAFATSRELPLRTVVLDLAGRRLGQALERAGASSPSVVTCFDYLDRDLLASVPADLPAGCRFVAAIATTTNLERHRRPSARYLLRPGELAGLVGGSGRRSLAVLHRREGWADDRHRAEIVVERR